MRRKKLVISLLVLFVVFVGAAGTLLWALLRVPAYYTAASASIPRDPAERKQAAKLLVQETTNLVNNIKHADEWSATFKQRDVNSWLVEELPQEKYAEVIPEGVSDPRVSIQENRVQVGFRFRKNGWSGIVSLKLKPWIQSENQLALEIESIQAGIVPIPLEEMLHELSQQLVDAGWDVTWNHANGHDVAVFRFKQQKADSPVLESLLIEDGEVRVRGHKKNRVPAQSQVHHSPKSHASSLGN